jgi:hypothetical protein
MSAVGLGVRQLKDILDAARVDYRGCTEKSELVAKVDELRKRGSTRTTASGSSKTRPAAPVPKPRVYTEKDKPFLKEIERVHKAKNLYDVLSCAKSASASEIKKAYRKLALKLHPDKCTIDGAEEAFKKVASAYSCLSNKQSKAQYDMFGDSSDTGSSSGAGYQGMGPTGDVDAWELFRAVFNEDEDGDGNPFESFFGGGGGGGNRGDGGGQVATFSGMAGRVFSAFAKNPWTLVTALCALGSVFSMIEMVMDKPYLLVFPAVAWYSPYRKEAAILFGAILMSGVLI